MRHEKVRQAFKIAGTRAGLIIALKERIDQSFQTGGAHMENRMPQETDHGHFLNLPSTWISVSL
jgi:hypothetical protein